MVTEVYATRADPVLYKADAVYVSTAVLGISALVKLSRDLQTAWQFTFDKTPSKIYNSSWGVPYPKHLKDYLIVGLAEGAEVVMQPVSVVSDTLHPKRVKGLYIGSGDALSAGCAIADDNRFITWHAQSSLYNLGYFRAFTVTPTDITQDNYYVWRHNSDYYDGYLAVTAGNDIIVATVSQITRLAPGSSQHLWTKAWSGARLMAMYMRDSSTLFAVFDTNANLDGSGIKQYIEAYNIDIATGAAVRQFAAQYTYGDYYTGSFFIDHYDGAVHLVHRAYPLAISLDGTIKTGRGLTYGAVVCNYSTHARHPPEAGAGMFLTPSLPSGVPGDDPGYPNSMLDDGGAVDSFTCPDMGVLALDSAICVPYVGSVVTLSDATPLTTTAVPATSHDISVTTHTLSVGAITTPLSVLCSGAVISTFWTNFYGQREVE